MNELALFAGAGGGILGGVLTGFKTVCAVEWEPYAQAVLLARQADGHLERFPIWDDVKTFNGAEWRGKIDIITAGFPCQPFSSAGKRKGEADSRNMWPDTARIIRNVAPRFALLENVPGLLNWDGGRYFGEILGELSESGFDAVWKVISAAEIGAPHKRDRLWILAYPSCRRYGMEKGKIQAGRDGTFNSGKHLAHSGGNAASGREEPRSGGDGNDKQNDWNKVGYEPSKSGSGLADTESQSEEPFGSRNEEAYSGPSLSGWWAVEPALGRVAHGVAYRVDRLKAIGNGQVAGVAAKAFRILSEFI